LIDIIDNSLIAKDRRYKKLLKEYKNRYIRYREKLNRLNKIKEDELRLAELIEFAKFEIEKIENINPKIGEDEELLRTKNQLSKIDKINEALSIANEIFTFEEAVNEVYRLLDKDNSFFVEMINQLRADFEDIELLSEELEEIDIEYILNRLEQISYLKSRYGGIKEALEYAKKKKRELNGYKNIEQDKSALEKFLELEKIDLMTLSSKITQYRKKEALVIESELKGYLYELRLAPINFKFKSIPIYELGVDEVDIDLDGSNILTLSGGEFNRVRLALLVVGVSNKREKGVLILDEIDANVSGDESIAIANMIAKLSLSYQIFAISHQPHLASKANQHILITKRDTKSRAIVLDREGRIDEIARIIGGEKPNNEAINFAIKLLD
jgi:DNA repair protein RecN (Recombination protein N)